MQKSRKIVLASQSPRRKQLIGLPVSRLYLGLKELGVDVLEINS